MKVREIRPGASQHPVVAERVARATCKRPHRDPDPCYDLDLTGDVMGLNISGGVNPVHIPGCMGCAVYGHDRCTCDPPTINREGETGA